MIKCTIEGCNREVKTMGMCNRHYLRSLKGQPINNTFKGCLECGTRIPEHKRSDAKFCCDTCANKFRSRRRYRKFPEEYRRKREIENSKVEKRIYIRIKSRCKKKDIPFDLEISDIVVPEYCPVLGIPINPQRDRWGLWHFSPSLDRIEPDRGYVKGNIRVISWRANLLKSDATIEELELVLQDLKRLRL